MESDAPAERFVHLLSGKWIVQAIAAAAELGVADHLAVPLTVEALAERAGCRREPLRRLLRVLSGEGLVEELPSGEFAVTEVGQQLRADKQGMLAQFVGSASQWTPWLYLAETVRTERCAFELAHGDSLFGYLQRNPAESRLYDEAVDTFTVEQAKALGRSGLFSEVDAVVDIGGGRGTLLLELLDQYPKLHGTLLDLPHVVSEAKSRFERAGVLERCCFVEGDFFRAVPEGADCYVIKHVLHNWSDDEAIDLLRACRKALSLAGCIIVVEGLLLPGNHRDLARFMDLEMMVLTGRGRERSKPEFRRLFSRAGLRMTRTLKLSAGAWALVAETR